MTGSQFREFQTGIIWSCLRVPMTSWIVEYSTLCTCVISVLGRPHGRTLLILTNVLTCMNISHQYADLPTTILRTSTVARSNCNVVHVFATFRIDYYNINLLQRIQNSATNTRKYDRITPILQKLHWLPVRQRIHYKISLITYKYINDNMIWPIVLITSSVKKY